MTGADKRLGLEREYDEADFPLLLLRAGMA